MSDSHLFAVLGLAVVVFAYRWIATRPRPTRPQQSDSQLLGPPLAGRHHGSDNRPSIPDEATFERASRAMSEGFRNLDQVEKRVFARFRGQCPLPLCYFAMLPQRNNEFEAYVFFETNLDVAAAHKQGTTEAVERAVYEELERAGRGTRPDITVRFEFDSHENVVANYRGSYYLRMR